VPNLDQGGMGCQNAGDGTQRSGNPTDPGQPLAGMDVSGRAPADVGREAEARGLVVRYHLEYATTNDGGGYAECWCTPPTEGQVAEVFWGSNGQLFVVADTAMKPGGRAINQRSVGAVPVFSASASVLRGHRAAAGSVPTARTRRSRGLSAGMMASDSMSTDMLAVATDRSRRSRQGVGPIEARHFT
jgi:hypothetical protein